MYLNVKQVAERYGVSTDCVRRWSFDAASPFPRPKYFGADGAPCGFGGRKGGAVARWSMNDLVAYESVQFAEQDDKDPAMCSAKRGAMLAALRRAYPELRDAPAGDEVLAQRKYESHYARKMQLIRLAAYKAEQDAA